MKMNIKYSIIYISILFFSLVLAGCINKGGAGTAIVKIDLGLGNKSAKALSKSAPADLLSAELKVTGEDFAPIVLPVPVDTGQVILEVPSGKARTFEVAADSPISSYLGVTTVDLKPGINDVLIIMNASYKSEGTKDAPVYVPLNNYSNLHMGHVSDGISYYYTNAVGNSFLSIKIYELTDDGDLVDFGGDSSYNSEVSRPNIGRTYEETIYENGFNGTLYFAVDGSKTGYNSATKGAAYIIYIESHNGAVSTYINEGTFASPKVIPDSPPGARYFGQVAGEGTSYYAAEVETGVPYVVNVLGGDYSYFYSDQFITEISSFPYSTNSGFIYIIVSSGSSSSVPIEIVQNEGSAASPVYLYPEKTNFAEVADGSSYYLFRVVPGTEYTVVTSQVSPISNYIDIDVYNDGAFTNLIGSSKNGVSSNEYVTFTAETDTAAVQVYTEVGGGSGACFQIMLVLGGV